MVYRAVDIEISRLWTHPAPIARLNGGQMPRLFAILVPLIFLVLVASACNDSGVKTTPTSSPTSEATATATPTPAATPTPTPPPTPTPVPTPTPKPVTQIKDPSGFFARYTDAGKTITQLDCTLDSGSRQVDCGDKGRYRPDPQPASDAKCNILMVDGEPIAVGCLTTGPPLSSTYYEVKQ